ncbi:hypothetical protein D3C76_205460 [compost metagenome]
MAFDEHEGVIAEGNPFGNGGGGYYHQAHRHQRQRQHHQLPVVETGGTRRQQPALQEACDHAKGVHSIITSSVKRSPRASKDLN